MMQTPKTRPGNAHTFLTHLFGRGLEDERYAVERFRSMDDGEVCPLPAGGRTARADVQGRSARPPPGEPCGRCGPRGTRSSSARP